MMRSVFLIAIACSVQVNAEKVKFLLVGDTQYIMNTDRGDLWLDLKNAMANIGSDPVTQDAVALLSMGDMIESGRENLAPLSYDRLEVVYNGLDIPYVPSYGNNDQSGGWNGVFPKSQFTGLPQYVASNGDMQTSVHEFNAGGVDWLVVTIKHAKNGGTHEANNSAITWAKSQISSHPDHKVIIVSHAAKPGNNVGVLAKQFENVVMICSGHTAADKETFTVKNGKKCASIRHNWHSREFDHYLLVVEMDTGTGKITCRYYSPLTGKYGDDTSTDFWASDRNPMNPIAKQVFDHPWTWSGFDFGEVIVQDEPNDSQFVSMTVPSFMAPGETLPVEITLKNTGDDTWTTSGAQHLGSRPNGDTTWTGSARESLPNDVPSDQNVTFSFDITAPTTPGAYNFQWMMVDDSNPNQGWFGDTTPNVEINVGVVDLATAANLIADSGGFQSGKEVSYIHDGDIETPSAKNASSVWVEYDFGGSYTLSSANIFGDDGGGWYSQSWTLQAWNGSSYVDVFTAANCNATDWFEESIDVTTSKAKVIINGNPTDGTEVFEIQIIGSAAITEEMPPTFTSAPVTSAIEGEAYNYSFSASDPNGDTLTYTAPVKPSWLTFNAGSRTLSGTPATGDIGSDSVTLRVTDGTTSVDQPFTIVIFDASDSTLLQHLDASVSSSVTGSTVSQWADQTANGNHATAGNGSVLYPSSSTSASGLTGLDLGSSDNSLDLFSAAASEHWLDFSGNASGKSGFSVLVAFKCDALNTGSWNDLIGNSMAITSGFGMRYSKEGNPQIYLGGVTINPSGSSVQAGDTLVFAFNYDASGGSYTFWDSKNASEASATVAAGDFSTGASVTLGRTTATDRYIDGMVGEVKIFDVKLSSAKFQTERDALVAKWIDGITNVAPTWNSSPTTKAAGQVSVPYNGSLSGDASDLDGDSLMFTKTGGIGWLNVAANGALSGTPQEVGTNWATVTVSDGVNPAVSVTVNILVTAAPLDGYDAWAEEMTVEGSATGDDDNDGLSNFYEYALNGDPKSGGDAVEPSFTLGSGGFEYAFKERNDDTNLSYTVQSCTDLSAGSWTNAGSTVIQTGAEEAYNHMQHTIPVDGSHKYIRLEIIRD